MPNNVYFKKMGGLHTMDVPFHGQMKKCMVKLAPSQMEKSETILFNIGHRMLRPAVTEKLGRKVGVFNADGLKAFYFNGENSQGETYLRNGVCNASTDVGEKATGDKIALGESGGGHKAIVAHKGAELSITEHGIKVDAKGVVSGSAVGEGVKAIAAKDIEKNGIDPDTEKRVNDELARLKSKGFNLSFINKDELAIAIKCNKLLQKLWVEYNVIETMRDTSKEQVKRDNCSGAVSGEAMGRILNGLKKEAKIESLELADIKWLVLIALTEANGGQDYFCADENKIGGAMFQDIEKEQSTSIQLKIVDQQYIPKFLSKIPLNKILKTTGAFPGIFDVVQYMINEKPSDLNDGGQLNNKMIRILTALIDYDKFLFLDTGYAGQNKGMMRYKNFLQVILQAIEIIMSREKGDLQAPQSEDIAIRHLNYGMFNISSFGAWDYAHEVMIAARESTDFLLEPFMLNGVFNSNKFWSKWKDSDPAIQTILGRMTVKKFGVDNPNIYSITDRNSMTMNIDHPAKQNYIDMEGGLVPTAGTNIIQMAGFGVTIIDGFLTWHVRHFFKKIIDDIKDMATPDKLKKP
jgi:hypothetical protein